MEKGRISIIIPTFNRVELLAETLDSFLAQTDTNWECLVVDDGSEDGTQDRIKSYATKDARFQFHQRPEDRAKGANACRNYGFEMSSGEFINWFDSDDLVAIDYLEKRRVLLEANPDLDMVACYGERFYVDGRPNSYAKPVDNKTENEIENYILHDFSFYTPSPLWRKKSLREKGELFDETMHRSQEKDFHFRMIAKGIRYERYVAKPLFFIRGDNEGITSKSGTSLKAKYSVFKLRDKQFHWINTSNNAAKEKLTEYLFYRQADNYYNLLASAKTASERAHFRKEYYPKLLSMVTQSHLGKGVKNRLQLGNFLMRTLKRGYKFFYFPQFDYRSF